MANLKLSCEFFPPKTEKGRNTLLDTATRLRSLDPVFWSMTHGAGGSDGARTLDAVRTLSAASDVPVAAHVTCVGKSVRDIDTFARSLLADGITRIVALRGDPPKTGAAGPASNPNGYPHASDLIAGLKRIADFDISAAAFPEGHPETAGIAADIVNLKRKETAGASRAITQFFFDTRAFLRYRDAAARAGVSIEIVPGIFPIAGIESLLRFAETCGATVPGWVVEAFSGYEDDAAACHEIAVDIAARQLSQLRAQTAFPPSISTPSTKPA